MVYWQDFGPAIVLFYVLSIEKKKGDVWYELEELNKKRKRNPVGSDFWVYRLWDPCRDHWTFCCEKQSSLQCRSRAGRRHRHRVECEYVPELKSLPDLKQTTGRPDDGFWNTDKSSGYNISGMAQYAFKIF